MAKVLGSLGGTKTPFSPCFTKSLFPRTSVETIGNPHAMASRRTVGSLHDMREKRTELRFDID